jgi:hypothetical protein
MTAAATDQGRECWHNWRQCPCPPDLVSEIEEIARHRQCKPRKVVWELVREALQARRGRPRGKQAAKLGSRDDSARRGAAPMPLQYLEPMPPLPDFVFRENKYSRV